MRMKINQKMAGGASAIGAMSRRSFLAATAAAAVPGAAVAEAAAKTHRLPQTLDHQLDDCVAQLRSVLLKMHPAVGEVEFRKDQVGEGFFIWMTGNPSQSVEWTEVGLYQVRASRHVSAGNYRVRRVWSDMDQRHVLYGSFFFEGEFVAPAEVIEPWQLVCKLEGGTL